MRVCLISPGHLSTNPRIMKEARALRAVGHAVHVICGRFTPWGTASDAPLITEMPTTTAVPFGPTEASHATYLRQSTICHGARSLVRYGLMRQNLVEAAHNPVVRDLTAAAQRVQADLYIAHYVAALPAAARAARRHDAAYAFDAEDFHLGDLPDTPEHSFEKHVVRAIEERYLSGAIYVTAASPLIAEAYAEAYGIPLPSVIMNVFPRTNAPSVPTARGLAQFGPSIYWFSQTIGPGRGLETVLEAVALAQSKPHCYLRGLPLIGYDVHLRNIAAQAGIAERLHFLDRAPPDELERLGANFDTGYVGEMPETVSRQLALTNKLFSYLLGGVPSFVTDIPAHRLLAPELGEAVTLFPCGDAVALAIAIDNLLADQKRLAAARAHAWYLGQTRFNWDMEQTRLIESVGKVMACRKPF